MSQRIDPSRAASLIGAAAYGDYLKQHFYQAHVRLRDNPSKAEVAQQTEAMVSFLSEDIHVRNLLTVMGKPVTDENMRELREAYQIGLLKSHQHDEHVELKAAARGETPSREDYAKAWEKAASKDVKKMLTGQSLEHTCGSCAKTSAAIVQRCIRCRKVFYCDRNCQTAHWPQHKLVCPKKASVGAGAAPSAAGGGAGPSPAEGRAGVPSMPGPGKDTISGS